MAAKTINTRIQLKNDTEANWKKSVLPTDNSQGTKVSGTSFVPLLGELIIFSADDAHPFSRLKVGNGTDDVLTLPFIDAGTISGETLASIILLCVNKNAFPPSGDSDKLYIDLNKNTIYCYNPGSGYTQLSHFKYSATTTTIPVIDTWDPGTMTAVTQEGNSLKIEPGVEPTLTTKPISVVTEINEVNE